MQKIAFADIDGVIPVFQYEDHTRLGLLVGRNHRTHAPRRMLYIRIILHVGQQVETELVESQVHDVDACVHILEVNHLFLKTFELFLAIVEVGLLFVGEQHIPTSCTSDIHPSHSCFHAPFQTQVVVEFNIRPIVDQLDHIVMGANTVDTAKTLDNTDWVPMNIEVDQIVAVLQVLTFADAVGGNQHIDSFRNVGQQLLGLF